MGEKTYNVKCTFFCSHDLTHTFHNILNVTGIKKASMIVLIVVGVTIIIIDVIFFSDVFVLHRHHRTRGIHRTRYRA